MEESLVPTSPTEYRKDKTKMIKLSSGAIFEIRKMPITALADMLTELGMDIPPGTPLESINALLEEKMKDPMMKTKTVRAIITVLPRCIVKPIITDTPTEGALTMDDLAPDDIFELFDQIMEFSGISKVAEKLREKFRNQSGG